MNQVVNYDSNFTVEFKIFDLNDKKYDILMYKALKIRDFKNYVSTIVSGDIKKYMVYKWQGLVKEFQPINLEGLTGYDRQRAVRQIHEAYDKKLNSIQLKLNTKVQKEIVIEYYKRATKPHKKGDLKEFYLTKKETFVTKTIDFLMKYGSDNIVTYIDSVLVDSKINESKLQYYTMLKRVIDKFGFERLFVLATNIKERIYENSFKIPIEFKSLNYTTCSRVKDDIISYNKTKGSVYNAFINLGGYVVDDKIVKISIPTKYSEDYHGSMADLNKKETTYTVNFNKRGGIRIILSKKGKRNVVVSSDVKTDKVLGVDLNVKNNLFAPSSLDNIDYDRNLLKDYVKFLIKIDKGKKCKIKMGFDKETTNSISKKNTSILKQFIGLIDEMYVKKSLELIKDLKEKGFDHVVLEDIGIFGAGYSKSEDYLGFKYSRLVKLLHLSDVKNIFKRLAYKNGLVVTLVHPEYTSQQCNICGHIHKNNRKTQEVFQCVECGYTLNADKSSSINILNSVINDVLRDSLLTKNSYGEWIPKKLNKFQVKSLKSVVQQPVNKVDKDIFCT